MRVKYENKLNLIKVAITGTKGKTTTLRMADYVLRNLGFNTLRVDTDGHFVNGKQKSNMRDSYRYWGFVPNLCPGRYLFELKKMESNKKKIVALLETAIGCYSRGLGYNGHEIGVFTNIFEDHITGDVIKNKDDIYETKKFIIKWLAEDGFFIFNSDDRFLTRRISNDLKKYNKIAVGKELTGFDCKQFISEGNLFFRIESDGIFFISDKGRRLVIRKKSIPVSFSGSFLPMVYNTAIALAIIYRVLGGVKFEEKLSDIIELIKKYKMDSKGGRMVVLKDPAKGVKVVIDFAHEGESLKQIADFAGKMEGKRGRVIGVLRIDPTRTNEEVKKIAKKIYKKYNYIYIYDKLDGVGENNRIFKNKRGTRSIGEMARVFRQALIDLNCSNHEEILNEKKAFKKAYENSRKNDVIIFIGRGTDHGETLAFVKKILKQ